MEGGEFAESGRHFSSGNGILIKVFFKKLELQILSFKFRKHVSNVKKCSHGFRERD